MKINIVMCVRSAGQLKCSLIQSLPKRRGCYQVKDRVIQLPEAPSKDDFRDLNKLAIQKKLKKSGLDVLRYEDRLIQFLANGVEVVPDQIRPKLVLAKRYKVV